MPFTPQISPIKILPRGFFVIYLTLLKMCKSIDFIGFSMFLYKTF